MEVVSLWCVSFLPLAGKDYVADSVVLGGWLVGKIVLEVVSVTVPCVVRCVDVRS